jgi:uncharacterized delta-60 repeat protein
MKRPNARTYFEVAVLLGLATLPFRSSTGLAASQPHSAQAKGSSPHNSGVPVTTVNPTASDCYAGPGCLDSSFGVLGKVRQDVGGTQNYTSRYQTVLAVAVQSDGKLLAAGPSRLAGADATWIVSRLNTDGTLDPSFGVGGIAVLANFTPTLDTEWPYAIAVQSDGKIVVAGWAGGTSTPSVYLAGVVRLTASGSPDPTFGSGGTVIVDFGGRIITAMKLQADGRILLAADGGSTLSVARLNTNGAVDATFGSNGFREVSFVRNEMRSSVSSLALQSTGKIIVGGTTTNGVSGGADFALCRLTTAGAVDTTFGNKGVITVDFLGYEDQVKSISVALDDSIVAAGRTSESLASNSIDMSIARFTATGAVMTSFGTSGKVVLNMHGANDQATGVVIRADNTIVFTGYAFSGDAQLPSTVESIIVGRLQANGALDPGFGTGGVTETRFSDHWDQANALVIDANGEIVAAGHANDSSTNPTGKITWALARYFQ